MDMAKSVAGLRHIYQTLLEGYLNTPAESQTNWDWIQVQRAWDAWDEANEIAAGRMRAW